MSRSRMTAAKDDQRASREGKLLLFAHPERNKTLRVFWPGAPHHWLLGLPVLKIFSRWNGTSRVEQSLSTGSWVLKATLPGRTLTF